MYESVLQKAVKQVVKKAGLAKPASCLRSVTPLQLTSWRVMTSVRSESSLGIRE